MSFKNFDGEKWGENIFSKIGIKNTNYQFDDGQFEGLEEKCFIIPVADIDNLLNKTSVALEYNKIASILEEELVEGDLLIYTEIVAGEHEKEFKDYIKIGYKILKKGAEVRFKNGLTQFIPTLWKDRCYVHCQNNSILAPLMNREYEGVFQEYGDVVKMKDPLEELKKGDTEEVVRYTPFLEDDERFLVTGDQKNVVAIMVDDVNIIQNNLNIFNNITGKMGKSWARKIDEDLASFLAKSSKCISKNTVYRINSMDIENLISMMKKKFDDHNLPEKNRVAIIPPWFVEKCNLSDLGRDKFKESKDPGVKSSGYVYSYKGFDFYKSNSIRHAGNEWYELVFFIREESVGFADEVTRMEASKIDGKSKAGVRGLMLYGMTAIRPSSIFSIKLVPGLEKGSEIDKEYRLVSFKEFKEKK